MRVFRREQTLGRAFSRFLIVSKAIGGRDLISLPEGCEPWKAAKICKIIKAVRSNLDSTVAPSTGYNCGFQIHIHQVDRH